MSTLAIKRLLSDPYVLAKGAVFLTLAYLCLGIILPAVLSTWEETHTAGTLTVTPAMRTAVVESLADKVSRHYLDAQKAPALAQSLREALREGAYDAIASPSQFARALSADLRAASGDPHVNVSFSPAEVPEFGDRNFPPPPRDELSLPAWLVDRVGRSMANFGVDEVSRSDAGIGYIRLTGFFRPYLSAEKYAAAMDRVAGTRALIIDLRNNGGGSRDAVALLASYFFDEPTLLSEVVAPRTGERLQMWTRKDIAGKRYGSRKPVYLLTSRATFSAGEDFAYAMQTRKRAIVVGEVTQGGAHPVAPFRLSSHFMARLPVAQTISPLTHTNWEGTGVQPDIVTGASYALGAATNAILKEALAVEAQGGRRARLWEWPRQEQRTASR